jgi:hypothetical protein
MLWLSLSLLGLVHVQEAGERMTPASKHSRGGGRRLALQIRRVRRSEGGGATNFRLLKLVAPQMVERDAERAEEEQRCEFCGGG